MVNCSIPLLNRILIEWWRKEYNQVRPHSALGYRPPAPQNYHTCNGLNARFNLVQLLGGGHFHALEVASRVHARAVGLLLCDLNLDFPDQESVPQSKGDAPRVVHQHY